MKYIELILFENILKNYIQNFKHSYKIKHLKKVIVQNPE